MAKIYSLPMDEEIELVARKDGVVHRKIMKYGDALALKKNYGWRYDYFQVGFCEIK